MTIAYVNSVYSGSFTLPLWPTAILFLVYLLAIAGLIATIVFFVRRHHPQRKTP